MTPHTRSELNRRHAEYFLRIAKQGDGFPPSPELVDRLRDDIGNLRGALRWSIENAPELGIQLAVCLDPFWARTGRSGESYRWLRSALAVESPGNQTLRARALLLASNVAYRLGKFRDAEAECSSGLKLVRTLRYRKLEAGFLHMAGVLAQGSGNHAEAETHFRASLRILRVFRKRAAQARTLARLGHLAYRQNRIADSGRCLAVAIPVLSKLDMKDDLADALDAIGRIMRSESDFPGARSVLRLSLRLHVDAGDLLGVGCSLFEVARLEDLEGRPRPAARILGASATLPPAFDHRLQPDEQQRRKSFGAYLRERLGDAEFDLEFRRGTNLGLEEIARLVIAEGRFTG